MSQKLQYKKHCPEIHEGNLCFGEITVFKKKKIKLKKIPWKGCREMAKEKAGKREEGKS